MTTLDSRQRSDFDRVLTELCVRLPTSVGSAGLARELSAALSPLAPELAFRDVLTRGGWFRLGGVIDAAGQHVAEDMTRWGEDELAKCGDDLYALYDRYAGQGFRATRLIGRTHYLVAATGAPAADFLQEEAFGRQYDAVGFRRLPALGALGAAAPRRAGPEEHR